MTNTLFVHGPILVGDGLAAHPTRDGWASDYCSVDGGLADEQPDRIDVHVNHRGPVIGHVVHLEARHRKVFAEAEIDADAIDPDDLAAFADPAARWRWSPSLKPGAGSDRMHIVDATITELSLTANPASVGLDPVRCTSQRPHRLDRLDMRRRTATTIAERRYRYGVPLRILRLDDRGRPIEVDPVVRDSSDGRPVGMAMSYSAHRGRVLAVR